MPALVAFGRRWLIAGDDLLLPGIIGFCLHAVWFTVFMFMMLQTLSTKSECQPRSLLGAYLSFNIALCSAQMIVEAFICWTSLQGTVREAIDLALRMTLANVSDDRPRRGLKFWVPVHTCLVLLDFWAQGLGFYVIAGPNPLTCPGYPAVTVITKACVSLIFISLILWLVAFGFIFSRSSPMDVAALDHRDVWLKRLAFICSGHRKQASALESGDVLRDVARIFADFFKDADTVVSDVMVGLIYVRRKQRHERMQKLNATQNGEAFLSSVPVSTAPRTVLDVSSAKQTITSSPFEDRTSSPEFVVGEGIPLSPTGLKPDLGVAIDEGGVGDSSTGPGSTNVTPEEIMEIAYYVQYAEAIYGLPLFMLTNFFAGLKFLLCPTRTCCGLGPPHSQTLVESVQTHLGRPGWPFCCIPERPPRHRPSDLLALSLDNGLFRSPYIVALDHEKQAVVVAVRGTLSTADVLVDLNCDLATIHVPWGESGQMVSRTHSGMLITASNIRDEISGLLEELVLNPSSRYYNYKLVVCGHSLGAGVASLLSYLLNIKGHRATCYAYSPPGCISTAEAVPYFSTFCTSIVLGDDIVPRLNRRTIERLKLQVTAAVRSCRRRKLEVLGGFVLADLFGIKAAALDSRDDGWWERWDGEGGAQRPAPEQQQGEVEEEDDDPFFGGANARANREIAGVRPRGGVTGGSTSSVTTTATGADALNGATGSEASLIGERTTPVNQLMADESTTPLELEAGLGESGGSPLHEPLSSPPALATAEVRTPLHAGGPNDRGIGPSGGIYMAGPNDLAPEKTVMHVPGRVLYLAKERVVVPNSVAPGANAIEEPASDPATGGFDSPEEEEHGWGILSLSRRATAAVRRRAGISTAAPAAARSPTPGSEENGGVSHVRRQQTSSGKAAVKKQTVYRPAWVQPSEINDIVISATMGADHLPNSLGVVLRRVADMAANTGKLATDKVPYLILRLILVQLFTLGDFTLDTLIELCRKHVLFFRSRKPLGRGGGSQAISAPRKRPLSTLMVLAKDQEEQDNAGDESFCTNESEDTSTEASEVDQTAGEWYRQQHYSRYGSWGRRALSVGPVSVTKVREPQAIVLGDNRRAWSEANETLAYGADQYMERGRQPVYVVSPIGARHAKSSARAHGEADLTSKLEVSRPMIHRMTTHDSSQRDELRARGQQPVRSVQNYLAPAAEASDHPEDGSRDLVHPLPQQPPPPPRQRDRKMNRKPLAAVSSAQKKVAVGRQLPPLPLEAK
ncbi:hypothetical protein HDU96_004691 [Phlyctochytrium bullatum]|nr:hypothetical protein HDU96_004691 [Phlyctochytrium bullatum]